jgi:Flp pilus assembly pilin Flp
MAKINDSKKIQQTGVKSLFRDVEGLSTVEYIIILCLIAVVGIVAWRNFGTAVKTKAEAGTGEINGL